MVRISLFCVLAGTLAQVGPQGCPLTPTDGTIPVEPSPLTVTVDVPTSANAGETVALAATATGAVDGGAISYAWVQVSGIGVKIVDGTTANASFVAPSLAADQTLSFIVAAVNARGDSGRATVDVLIPADPNFGSAGQSTTGGPIARAGADRTAAGGSTVTLDGSNSRGNTLTYQWTQVSGTTVTIQSDTSAQATFTAPAFDVAASNRLEFRLEVRDSAGRRATDNIVIWLRQPTPAEQANSKPRVSLHTSMGDFVVELNADKAPKTVANFLQYVDDKFYDGTIFHRVIKNFVVQGGGYLPGLTLKTTRAAVENESTNGLKNLRGTVAMARTADANSATSQFYVNLVDNSSLDAQSGKPGYTVFGTVVEGMGVVDSIGQVPTGTTGGMGDVPMEDVLLITATRVVTATP